MVEGSTGADRGVGLTIGLGLVAVGGALLMGGNPGDPLAGWGFAVAIVAAALAVAAAQLYG